MLAFLRTVVAAPSISGEVGLLIPDFGLFFDFDLGPVAPITVG